MYYHIKKYVIPRNTPTKGGERNNSRGVRRVRQGKEAANEDVPAR